MDDKEKKINGIKKETKTTQEILSSLYSMLAPQVEEEDEESKAKNRYNGSTGTLYANPEDLKEDKK